MKNGFILSSNSPSVIDQSNLFAAARSGEVINLIGWWHVWNWRQINRNSNILRALYWNRDLSNWTKELSYLIKDLFNSIRELFNSIIELFN